MLSGEHLILIILALFAFGPKGLPKLGASAGKAAKGLRGLFSNDPTSNVIEPEYRRIDHNDDSTKGNH